MPTPMRPTPMRPTPMRPTPMRPTPMRNAFLVLGVIGLLASCGGSDEADVEPLGTTSTPARYTVRVVATYPHDEGSFTQGLVWANDDELFESTGRRGQSTVRRVDIATGETRLVHDLDEPYFGEGLAQVDDRLIQLTWQEDTAFVYAASSLEVTGTFSYTGEGWGLCFDGERLVMSSGDSTLVFRDSSTFEPIGDVEVTVEGSPLEELNELECVGDRVYANVLGDDNIYEIDPGTGTVTAVIDASSLEPGRQAARGEVLNGIAYSPPTGNYYLTGKNWPTLYEVTFEPAS